MHSESQSMAFGLDSVLLQQVNEARAKIGRPLLSSEQAEEFGQHDVLFLENRRTPKIVKKGERYQPKESEGRITKRRPATEDEEKTIARGDWVRVNERGEKPGDPGYMKKKSKIRPQHNSNESDFTEMAILDSSVYNFAESEFASIGNRGFRINRRKFREIEWLRDRKGRFLKFVGIPKPGEARKPNWGTDADGNETANFQVAKAFSRPDSDDVVSYARPVTPLNNQQQVVVEIGSSVNDLGRNPDPTVREIADLPIGMPTDLQPGETRYVRLDPKQLEIVSDPETKAGGRARLPENAAEAESLGENDPEDFAASEDDLDPDEVLPLTSEMNDLAAELEGEDVGTAEALRNAAAALDRAADADERDAQNEAVTEARDAIRAAESADERVASLADRADGLLALEEAPEVDEGEYQRWNPPATGNRGTPLNRAETQEFDRNLAAAKRKASQISAANRPARAQAKGALDAIDRAVADNKAGLLNPGAAGNLRQIANGIDRAILPFDGAFAQPLRDLADRLDVPGTDGDDTLVKQAMDVLRRIVPVAGGDQRPKVANAIAGLANEPGDERRKQLRLALGDAKEGQPEQAQQDIDALIEAAGGAPQGPRATIEPEEPRATTEPEAPEVDERGQIQDEVEDQQLEQGPRPQAPTGPGGWSVRDATPLEKARSGADYRIDPPDDSDAPTVWASDDGEYWTNQSMERVGSAQEAIDAATAEIESDEATRRQISDSNAEAERARQQAEADARQAARPQPPTQDEAQQIADEAGAGDAVKEALRTGDRDLIHEALLADEALGDRYFDWDTRDDVDLPTPEQRAKWEAEGAIFERLLNAQQDDEDAAIEARGNLRDLIEEDQLEQGPRPGIEPEEEPVAEAPVEAPAVAEPAATSPYTKSGEAGDELADDLLEVISGIREDDPLNDLRMDGEAHTRMFGDALTALDEVGDEGGPTLTDVVAQMDEAIAQADLIDFDLPGSRADRDRRSDMQVMREIADRLRPLADRYDREPTVAERVLLETPEEPGAAVEPGGSLAPEVQEALFEVPDVAEAAIYLDDALEAAGDVADLPEVEQAIDSLDSVIDPEGNVAGDSHALSDTAEALDAAAIAIGDSDDASEEAQNLTGAIEDIADAIEEAADLAADREQGQPEAPPRVPLSENPAIHRNPNDNLDFAEDSEYLAETKRQIEERSNGANARLNEASGRYREAIANGDEDAAAQALADMQQALSDWAAEAEALGEVNAARKARAQSRRIGTMLRKAGYPRTRIDRRNQPKARERRRLALERRQERAYRTERRRAGREWLRTIRRDRRQLARDQRRAARGEIPPAEAPQVEPAAEGEEPINPRAEEAIAGAVDQWDSLTQRQKNAMVRKLMDDFGGDVDAFLEDLAGYESAEYADMLLGDVIPAAPAQPIATDEALEALRRRIRGEEFEGEPASPEASTDEPDRATVAQATRDARMAEETSRHVETAASEADAAEAVRNDPAVNVALQANAEGQDSDLSALDAFAQVQATGDIGEAPTSPPEITDAEATQSSTRAALAADVRQEPYDAQMAAIDELITETRPVVQGYWSRLRTQLGDLNESAGSPRAQRRRANRILQFKREMVSNANAALNDEDRQRYIDLEARADALLNRYLDDNPSIELTDYTRDQVADVQAQVAAADRVLNTPEPSDGWFYMDDYLDEADYSAMRDEIAEAQARLTAALNTRRFEESEQAQALVNNAARDLDILLGRSLGAARDFGREERFERVINALNRAASLSADDADLIVARDALLDIRRRGHNISPDDESWEVSDEVLQGSIAALVRFMGRGSESGSAFIMAKRALNDALAAAPNSPQRWAALMRARNALDLVHATETAGIMNALRVRVNPDRQRQMDDPTFRLAAENLAPMRPTPRGGTWDAADLQAVSDAIAVQVARRDALGSGVEFEARRKAIGSFRRALQAYNDGRFGDFESFYSVGLTRLSQAGDREALESMLALRDRYWGEQNWAAEAARTRTEVTNHLGGLPTSTAVTPRDPAKAAAQRHRQNARANIARALALPDGSNEQRIMFDLALWRLRQAGDARDARLRDILAVWDPNGDVRDVSPSPVNPNDGISGLPPSAPGDARIGRAQELVAAARENLGVSTYFMTRHGIPESQAQEIIDRLVDDGLLGAMDLGTGETFYGFTADTATLTDAELADRALRAMSGRPAAPAAPEAPEQPREELAPPPESIEVPQTPEPAEAPETPESVEAPGEEEDEEFPPEPEPLDFSVPIAIVDRLLGTPGASSGAIEAARAVRSVLVAGDGERAKQLLQEFINDRSIGDPERTQAEYLLSNVVAVIDSPPTPTVAPGGTEAPPAPEPPAAPPAPRANAEDFVEAVSELGDRVLSETGDTEAADMVRRALAALNDGDSETARNELERAAIVLMNNAGLNPGDEGYDPDRTGSVVDNYIALREQANAMEPPPPAPDYARANEEIARLRDYEGTSEEGRQLADAVAADLQSNNPAAAIDKLSTFFIGRRYGDRERDQAYLIQDRIERAVRAARDAAPRQSLLSEYRLIDAVRSIRSVSTDTANDLTPAERATLESIARLAEGKDYVGAQTALRSMMVDMRENDRVVPNGIMGAYTNLLSVRQSGDLSNAAAVIRQFDSDLAYSYEQRLYDASRLDPSLQAQAGQEVRLEMVQALDRRALDPNISRDERRQALSAMRQVQEEIDLQAARDAQRMAVVDPAGELVRRPATSDPDAVMDYYNRGLLVGDMVTRRYDGGSGEHIVIELHRAGIEPARATVRNVRTGAQEVVPGNSLTISTDSPLVANPARYFSSSGLGATPSADDVAALNDRYGSAEASRITAMGSNTPSIANIVDTSAPDAVREQAAIDVLSHRDFGGIESVDSVSLTPTGAEVRVTLSAGTRGASGGAFTLRIDRQPGGAAPTVEVVADPSVTSQSGRQRQQDALTAAERYANANGASSIRLVDSSSAARFTAANSGFDWDIEAMGGFDEAKTTVSRMLARAARDSADNSAMMAIIADMVEDLEAATDIEGLPTPYEIASLRSPEKPNLGRTALGSRQWSPIRNLNGPSVMQTRKKRIEERELAQLVSGFNPLAHDFATAAAAPRLDEMTDSTAARQMRAVAEVSHISNKPGAPALALVVAGGTSIRSRSGNLGYRFVEFTGDDKNEPKALGDSGYSISSHSALRSVQGAIGTFRNSYRRDPKPEEAVATISAYGGSFVDADGNRVSPQEIWDAFGQDFEALDAALGGARTEYNRSGLTKMYDIGGIGLQLTGPQALEASRRITTEPSVANTLMVTNALRAGGVSDAEIARILDSHSPADVADSIDRARNDVIAAGTDVGNGNVVLQGDTIDAAYMAMGDDVQNTGLAGSLVKRMTDWGILNGIKAFDVHANISIGSYAWATAGFDWSRSKRSQALGVLNNIERQLKTDKDRADFNAVKARVNNMSESDPGFPTPFELSQIGYDPNDPSQESEYWAGKRGMFHLHWYGRKHLRNDRLYGMIVDYHVQKYLDAQRRRAARRRGGVAPAAPPVPVAPEAPIVPESPEAPEAPAAPTGGGEGGVV